MPQHKSIFVTGATGFLGSHLCYRLLQEGHQVKVLARGSKTDSAHDRAIQTLRDVAESAEELQPLLERLEVFEGDIAQPGLGLTEEAMRRIVTSTEEVWHCAASLSFAEEDRAEIFRMNIGGTENLLRLVEQIPGHRLQHVSTAYVAGNRPDLALETDIDVGQTFKNPYEESKCQAELLVAAARKKGLANPTVHRPSIVIGDSQTGRVTHFHGVYAFIRGLWAVLERMRRGQPEGSVVRLPLRLTGNKAGTLNFVPIDFVVDAMVSIALSPSSAGKTYNVTNPKPTPNAVWLPNICSVLRVEGIELVEKEAFAEVPMTKLESVFQKQMAFYYMYLQGEPRFDCSQTLDALKDTPIRCPEVTEEFSRKMAGWYVSYLNRS